MLALVSSTAQAASPFNSSRVTSSYAVMLPVSVAVKSVLQQALIETRFRTRSLAADGAASHRKCAVAVLDRRNAVGSLVCLAGHDHIGGEEQFVSNSKKPDKVAFGQLARETNVRFSRVMLRSRLAENHLLLPFAPTRSSLQPMARRSNQLNIRRYAATRPAARCGAPGGSTPPFDPSHQFGPTRNPSATVVPRPLQHVEEGPTRHGTCNSLCITILPQRSHSMRRNHDGKALSSRTRPVRRR